MKPYMGRAHELVAGAALLGAISAFLSAWIAPSASLFWWFALSGVVLTGCAGYYIATLVLRVDPRTLRPVDAA